LAINTQTIKELREATGAGVLDCKKALEANDDNFDKALESLREKGLDAAAKKASREAKEGLVQVLVDEAGRLGIIVEVNCETDFVARTEEFQALAVAIANQVAQEADIPDAATLLNHTFIEDQNITVGERLTQLIAKLGENLVLSRFARIERDRNGLIEGYIHPGSRIGVLVYMSTDSEDVTGSASFGELIHDIALQVAAAAPQYISPDDVPDSVIEAEKAKYLAEAAEDNKPDHIKERIVTGKLNKWYEETCLLRQLFIKDDSMSVADLITQKSKDLSAPLTVEQVVRYELESGG